MTTDTHGNLALNYPQNKRLGRPRIMEVFIIEGKEYISTQDAMGLMDLNSTQSVTHACRQKLVECRKLGRNWLVLKSDAESYERTQRGTYFDDTN